MSLPDFLVAKKTPQKRHRRGEDLRSVRPETMQVRRDLGIFTHDGFPWDVFGIFTYMKTIKNQAFIVGKYTFRPMDHIFLTRWTPRADRYKL